MAENHSKGAAIDSMTTVEAIWIPDDHSKGAAMDSMTTVEVI